MGEGSSNKWSSNSDHEQWSMSSGRPIGGRPKRGRQKRGRQTVTMNSIRQTVTMNSGQ